MSLCYHFSWVKYLGNKAGSYSKCLMFLRNCQIVFQNSSTILHSHQQYMSVTVPLHSFQHLVWSLFQILATVEIGNAVSSFNFYSIKILYLLHALQTCLPLYGLSFHSLNCILNNVKFLKLIKSHLFSHRPCFWGPINN